MTSRRISLLAALPVLGLVSLTCSPSLADYQSARDAYLRGDFASAFELALPSALEGNPRSRIGLGLMLARGQGVKPDLVRSYSWFDMAAAQAAHDHPVVRILARANLDHLRKRMTADQIAEARLRAAMMRATPESLNSAARLGFSLASETPKVPVAAAKATAADSAAVVTTARRAAVYQIQIAALRNGNADRLRSEWSHLANRHAALGKLTPALVRMDLGDFGVYEGLRAGPFDSPREAHATCNLLIESGQDCFVVAK